MPAINQRDPEYILLPVPGGLGKNICFTCVAKQVREKYPTSKIIVQTHYPDVYTGLDFITEVWPFPTPTQPTVPNFYANIASKAEVLEAEPYKDLAFRESREHLIDVWCRLLNVPLPAERKGILKLFPSELRSAKAMVGNARRPLIAFQFCGGTPNTEPQRALNPNKLYQARSLSTEKANWIVAELNREGYDVLQFTLPTEPKLKDALYLSGDNNVMPTRQMLALLNECIGLITIDSFCNHAWAALGKENAVALWGYSSATQYGYAGNTNMELKGKCSTPHCGRPVTHLYDTQGNADWVCPMDGPCMEFDEKEIVQATISAVRSNRPQMVPPSTPTPNINKPEDVVPIVTEQVK